MMRAAAAAVSKARSLLRGCDASDDAETDHATSPSVHVTESCAAASNRTTERSSNHKPLLYSLCKNWAWPAVTFRCKTHPHEVSSHIQDDNGDTALHWACFGKPPVDVVDALLLACPELASTPNRQGLLPLHYACSYRASADVIRSLVRAYPEGASVASHAGSYPMHILCDYGCSVDSIHALLETRGGIQTLSRLDQTFRRKPLSILNARKGMNEFHSAIFSLRQERFKRMDDSIKMRELVTRCESLDFWQKAAMLIQAEYTGRVLVESSEAVDHNHIVHACAGISDCPPTLLEYAMLLYPNQLLIPDNNGALPLHIAACHSDNIILNDVLAACPDAARVLNGHEQLPIEVAVEHGRVWSDGVGNLLESYPSSLEALNTDERLYPIVWSRLSNPSAIFESMRARPSICRNAHRDTSVNNRM